MKTKTHMLFIDDNEYNQRLAKKILGPADFTISHAGDGISGIKGAVELKPDLILLDLDLPYLDGMGVAAKIKSIEAIKNIPIVALASQSDKRARDRALVAGCNGIIDKPINAATFAAQLRAVLEGKHQVSEPSDRAKLLKDFNITLIDQLQSKVVELEETNQALLRSKDELQTAYQQSQTWNQEMQRLNKLKENIVTITSHELRTPLAIATGYIDLLDEGIMGDLNEEQRKALTITGQSLAKMQSLIDKITDLTRLAVKKFPIQRQKADLNDVFRTTVQDFIFFMKVRNIQLHDSTHAEAIHVEADVELLNQVFANLLKNAICFTPDGGEIKVNSWIDGNKVYFEIQDTGIGIPEEDLERIFDEFYQVQDVDHHKTGHFEFMTRGIGVGLAICKGILQELGGRITARSPGLNQGSTFVFYLPAVNRE